MATIWIQLFSLVVMICNACGISAKTLRVGRLATVSVALAKVAPRGRQWRRLVTKADRAKARMMFGHDVPMVASLSLRGDSRRQAAGQLGLASLIRGRVEAAANLANGRKGALVADYPQVKHWI